MTHSKRIRHNMDQFFIAIKEYMHLIYLAVAGYLGWNHKRIDNVILEQTKTAEKVENLKETLDHIRQSVDKLTTHLIDNSRQRDNQKK